MDEKRVSLGLACCLHVGLSAIGVNLDNGWFNKAKR